MDRPCQNCQKYFDIREHYGKCANCLTDNFKNKTMNKELTAVEWLWEQIDNTLPYQNIKTSQVFNGLLEKAKELHRQQIIDATIYGNENPLMADTKLLAEQYYNDKYGQ